MDFDNAAGYGGECVNPVPSPPGLKMAGMTTRAARIEHGLQACDQCYLPKYAGQPCKWCAMYEANPAIHYDTRPGPTTASKENRYPSPADVAVARVEAAKRRGIPPLRRGPAKRPGFWRG